MVDGVRSRCTSASRMMAASGEAGAVEWAGGMEKEQRWRVSTGGAAGARPGGGRRRRRRCAWRRRGGPGEGGGPQARLRGRRSSPTTQRRQRTVSLPAGGVPGSITASTIPPQFYQVQVQEDSMPIICRIFIDWLVKVAKEKLSLSLSTSLH